MADRRSSPAATEPEFMRLPAVSSDVETALARAEGRMHETAEEALRRST